MKHLVFFDGECGLCDHVVQILLKIDRNKIFAFAPLQGKTAAMRLKNIPSHVKQADSLILIENFESQNFSIYIYGQGALKILWLLGGFWSLLGVISFLPSFLYDWMYRLVARNRHYFFKKDKCQLPQKSEKERFLP